MDKKMYSIYLDILNRELIPAMGCTEPIAIALTAAKAKKYADFPVESVEVKVSGNIIKNVKSVMVPNTAGLRGIGAAAAAGIVAGNPDKELEVLAGIDEQGKNAIADFIKKVDIPSQKYSVIIYLFAESKGKTLPISRLSRNFL